MGAKPDAAGAAAGPYRMTLRSSPAAYGTRDMARGRGARAGQAGRAGGLTRRCGGVGVGGGEGGTKTGVRGDGQGAGIEEPARS